ncbi:MAG: hypothetical protein JRJ69_04790 [Deltaproteobacteria bacterium]|nr:hypothetical protein [Deltaproteobacteria bacterium]
MVAGLYMTLLPEAGGETAVLHAQDTGYGLNLGSPPPALVCRIAKSSALAESILKKESHDLHFDNIGQYLGTRLKNLFPCEES